jgi:hypothetical protein
VGHQLVIHDTRLLEAPIDQEGGQSQHVLDPDMPSLKVLSEACCHPAAVQCAQLYG